MSLRKVKFSDVCTIEREIVNPSRIGRNEVYVGLEDIESNSGRILSYHSLDNLQLKSAKFRFSNKHILYGKLRPYLNKVALPDRSGVCSTDILPLLPKEGKTDRLFLAYLIRTAFFFRLASERSFGANLPRISPQELEKFNIPFPEFKEQHRIGQLLNRIESALEKRRQTLALADEFLKSAFLEMFGDPARNPKKLDVVPCGAIASHVSSGSTPLGGDKTYLKEGILFIRSQNVLMNRLDLSDVAYISNEVHQRMKRTWVKKDDVLLNITGASIGRVAFFEGEDDTANVNQHVCIIRPDKNKVLPQYLSFLISMSNYQKTILGKNAGATRQAFNFDQIKRFQIPLAPLPEQQKFAGLVQKVEKLKEKQKQSETQLQNLFNSLMQRAFKGELFL